MNARLVTDEPSATDELSGAHQHIASTISNLIKGSPGGKFIKLEGQWGSGKSTVVRLLAEELGCTKSNSSKGESFLLFQYDAWVHSGDHLRRAFLASFVRCLVSSGWLGNREENEGENSWSVQLQYIARRFKSTSKTTTHFFSERARIVLSVLLGMGVASPFLLEVLKREMAERSSLVLSAAALLAGVLAATGIHLVADDLLGVLLKRAPDGEQVSISETPDPTSVEFQDMFRDLVQVALANSDRRLVIVVDNLDRLEFDDMRAAWSLLRSFLDNPIFESEEWFSRVWVLVPIADSTKLARASRSTSVQAAASISSTLEKIFQIRFSLPPPMLHSWKSYMLSKLVYAFGTGVEDFNDILRLYEIYSEDVKTPRGIISFVNDLVILRMEWGARVSLTVLAAYLVSRESLSDESFAAPPSVLQIVDRPNLQMTFAMLHLHAASEDEASYLLLRPQLESVLDSGVPSGLRELLERSPGAIHVLDRYIREDVRTYGSAQARLLQALCALGPLIVEYRQQADDTYFPADRVSHLLTSVYIAISEAPYLDLSYARVVHGVVALLSIAESEHRAIRAVLDALQRPVAAGPATSAAWMPSRDHVGDWVSNLVGLLSIPQFKATIASPDSERLNLPLESADWGELCAQLENSESSWILERCDAGIPMDAMESALTDRFIESEPTVGDLALLRQFQRRGNMDVFDRISGRMMLKYRDISLPHAEHLVCTLAGLLTVDRVRLKPVARRMLDSGVLLQYYLAEQSVGRSNRSEAITLFIIWATDGKELKPSHALGEGAVRATSTINNLLNGGIGLNEQQVGVYAKELCRLELFDLLSYNPFPRHPRGLLRDLVRELGKSEEFINGFTAASDVDAAWERFANTYALPESIVSQLRATASV